MKTSQIVLVISLLILTCSPIARAWDSTGHRVSAVIALEFSDENTRQKLLEILQHHPRYQQDFIRPMPNFARNGSADIKAQWLLGQAAYWPDIARGLPEAERAKYNRPPWHYIDGAWLRGSAVSNGNSYIGIPVLPGYQGKDANRVRNEDDVEDVMTGLDFNAALLADQSKAMAERAVALCWFLHLAADLHQPLHTGSLFSKALFPSGDRGGNGVETQTRTLHSKWDAAISAKGIVENVMDIIASISETEKRTILSDKVNFSAWENWLEESRQLLHQHVYSATMVEAITANDRPGGRLPKFTLSPSYVETMTEVSARRLGQAGLRMATWFNQRL